MTMLFLDLETRSQCDLTFHGLARYVRDPSTEVICMAYCFDDEPMQFWWATEKFPQKLIDYFISGGLITAHNADFERHLFDYVLSEDYDFDAPAIDQWRCSMIRSVASGYPGGLGDMARSLGLKSKKQASGTYLIKTYCTQNFLTEFRDGDRELMQTYCEDDVNVMREACKYLHPLKNQWDEYALTCKINDTGIPVDVELCEKSVNFSDVMQEDASRELQDITKDMPEPMTKHTQRKTRDAFLTPRLTEWQVDLITVYKKGIKKWSLDQDHRALLLDCEDLDYEVRRLLTAINNAGSSALKKYSVAFTQNDDGRVHNTFQFHGAQTGRFSGRGLQPHNMRRDAYSQVEAEERIDLIKSGVTPDAETLARLLRSMIKSDEGIGFSDWSAIEGRVAPWLVPSASGEDKLELYRNGSDVYSVTAALMLLKDADRASEISKDDRQTGKIAELSLQFGGAKGALMNMAKNYGKTFSDQDAQVHVDNWRRNNTWAGNQYGEGGAWEAFDNAVRWAFDSNHPVKVGHCDVLVKNGYLWLRLPSGRTIAYPKVVGRESYTTPWGASKRGPTFQSSIRPAAGNPPIRKPLRGAVLFQNATQGTAADILRAALLKADAAGIEIIGHVHDEIIYEGPREDGERLNEIMLEVPGWAQGLPLATGGVEWGTRYGK